MLNLFEKFIEHYRAKRIYTEGTKELNKALTLLKAAEADKETGVLTIDEFNVKFDEINSMASKAIEKFIEANKIIIRLKEES